MVDSSFPINLVEKWLMNKVAHCGLRELGWQGGVLYLLPGKVRRYNMRTDP